MISLAIIDENEFLRVGLRVSLETESNIAVTGEYLLDDEAASSVEDLKPDVALVGIRWPTTDGLKVCQEIRKLVPATRVVMLSATSNEEEMLAVYLAGAAGYISVNVPKSELICAIHILANGDTYFDRAVVGRVVHRLKEISSGHEGPLLRSLHPREESILALVSEGYGNEAIGEELKIATATVRNNITSLRSKLGLHSRAQLAAYAVRRGIAQQMDIAQYLPDSEHI